MLALPEPPPGRVGALGCGPLPLASQGKDVGHQRPPVRLVYRDAHLRAHVGQDLGLRLKAGQRRGRRLEDPLLDLAHRAMHLLA